MLMQPPRRLFIGLLPDRAVQLRIQRHARDWTWPQDARPTRFGRYHLTLHFLGNEVGAAPEMRLRAVLREVAAQPMELLLEMPQSWQKNGVAVLRPREHSGLRELRERIAQCLPYRCPPFTPHVTLARNAAGAVAPSAGPDIAWTVSEFVLVWSRLDTKPAQHVVLERFGLHGKGAASHQRGAQSSLF